MKKADKNSINIEGNNGADYVTIVQLDSNRIYLEIGACCVMNEPFILTAEAFAQLLTNIQLEQEKNLVELADINMKFSEAVKKEFLKGCKVVSFDERYKYKL